MKENDYFNKEFYQTYWQQNKYIIIYSLLLAVFSFGYELFNFTLSIDEELQALKKAIDTDTAIAVGRWGLYLINSLIIPHSVLPFLPILIALISISFTSIVFLSDEGNDSSGGFVFSVIFITSPIHSYYLAWNSALSYTIGMLFTVISYLFFKSAIENNKTRLKYYFISVILLGLALSIYQALLALFLVFCAYFLFINQFNSSSFLFKDTLKKVFWIFIVTGLAFLFYKIGDVSARYFLFDGKFFNNTAYLESFISWGKLPVKEILLDLMYNTGGHLLGMKNFGDVVCLSSKSLIFLVPIFLYFIYKSKISNEAKVFSVLLLGALFISPFTVNFINGKPLPTRALMSLAMMTAILWVLVYRHAGSILRRIMVVAAFIVLINNTYINTRLFYSSYVSWQADRDMANRIIERVYNLDPPVKNGKIQISFVGNYNHPKNELFVQSDVHGASFFGWDGGNPWRMRDFFRTVGINELNIVLYENLGFMNAKIEAMPKWPSKGSVKLIDNIVIIKLSDPIGVNVENQKAKLTFKQEFGTLPDAMQTNPIKSNSTTDFSVDIINDVLINQVNQKVLTAEENITIKGWAIDKPALEPASKVFLLINGKMHLTEYGTARPDVAKAYKNDDYHHVGWKLDLQKNDLKQGKYKMQIIIIGSDNNTYFGPDQIVEFEIR